MNHMNQTNKHPLVAPVAWQDFGKWCLTGQHGMRPIYLSVSPKGVLMDRDPVADRLIPLTADTPVAKDLVRIVNSHAELLASLRELCGACAHLPANDGRTIGLIPLLERAEQAIANA